MPKRRLSALTFIFLLGSLLTACGDATPTTAPAATTTAPAATTAAPNHKPGWYIRPK